jgi:ribonuclease HII
MASRADKKVFETYLWRDSEISPVVGIDEVGRGCLAGPVCAAAVILPMNHTIQGLTDSKLLSEARREKLAIEIYAQAKVGLGFATVQEIDDINILQASFLAMRRAIEKLKVLQLLRVDAIDAKNSGFRAENGLGNLPNQIHLLVDGNQRIPKLGLEFLQTCLVKGDLRAEPISAASIVAKVARDGLMKKWSEELSIYGFEENKGYGSEAHRSAIQKLGPSWFHRKSFSGVREHWRTELDQERTREASRELGGLAP